MQIGNMVILHAEYFGLTKRAVTRTIFMKPMKPETPSGVSKSVTIAVDDDQLSINGVSIRPPTDSSPLSHFLGDPVWCKERYIWHRWGITAFGNTRDRLTNFEIMVRANQNMSEDWMPNEVFTGQLLVGGVEVTPSTKIQTIASRKHGIKLKEVYNDTWRAGGFRYVELMKLLIGEAYIELQTTPDETVECVRISRYSGFLKGR